MFKNIIFWPKTTSIFKNEDGAIMIAALLILVLLTIIGISSNNISKTEVKIATHELIHQRNFYRAEGATLIAIKEMETSIAAMEEKLSDPYVDTPYWLWTGLETKFTNDMALESEFWEGNNYTEEATPPQASELSDSLSDTRYFVVHGGIAPGEGLEMGTTKIHRFGIYGRCESPKRGSTTIEIGYLKAF